MVWEGPAGITWRPYPDRCRSIPCLPSPAMPAAQVLVSSLLGSFMLIADAAVGAQARGTREHEVAAGDPPRLVDAGVHAMGRGVHHEAFARHARRLDGRDLVFGGWTNALPYLLRGFGINVFVMGGGVCAAGLRGHCGAQRARDFGRVGRNSAADGAGSHGAVSGVRASCEPESSVAASLVNRRHVMNAAGANEAVWVMRPTGPWGDYRRILVHGMSSHWRASRVGSSSAHGAVRTASVVAGHWPRRRDRGPSRTARERKIAGMTFRALERRTSFTWTGADGTGREKALRPSGIGEPEDYVLARPMTRPRPRRWAIMGARAATWAAAPTGVRSPRGRVAIGIRSDPVRSRLRTFSAPRWEVVRSGVRMARFQL